MQPLRRCEIRAATNHGVIGRDAALREGLTRDEIEALVRRGQWKRHLPKVYVPSSVPITWWTQLAAAREWAGPGALFSHRTAGALLELDGVPPGFVELVRHSGRSRDGLIVHRLRPEDHPRSLCVQGFPLTRGDRTVFDLFAVLNPAKATLALEDALRRRVTSIDRLWDIYVELGGRGRNGSKEFRRAVLTRDARDGKLASRMEAMLRSILRRVPPPKAIPQFPVQVGGRRFRIDFAYPDVKLGLEAHSIKWHLGVEKARADLARDRLLKCRDWTLLYYSFDDLKFRPNDVAAEVLEVRTRLEQRLF
ncbi:MAG: hypothetical protein KY391_05275 [Actinobacteria bacterium]|nr:hypothetical protein [Actinomycetota bacterium]